jgi:hypothetical protein
MVDLRARFAKFSPAVGLSLVHGDVFTVDAAPNKKVDAAAVVAVVAEATSAAF